MVFEAPRRVEASFRKLFFPNYSYSTVVEVQFRFRMSNEQEITTRREGVVLSDRKKR